MRSAQREGRLRPDFTADDIAGFTVSTLAGLALTNQGPRAIDRYVAIVFDGLSRLDAPPLPDS